MIERFRKYAHSTELEIVDVLVAFIVVTSAIMLLQLVFHVYEPVSALFLSCLACGGIGLVFVRKVVFPRDPWNIAAIILMGVLILMPRWSPFLYVEGGQDQGIYISMSSHFARTGGVSIKDRVREPLTASQKTEYDKRNNSSNVSMEGRSEGWHQPGVYIGELSKSSYVFQFYPLHPLWMGLAGKVLGEENRVYSLVLFSLLNVLMLALLVYELTGRRRMFAFLFAGLLALNPMHAFLSRFPVTENVTLFFSATALYYLARYFKDRDQSHEKVWHLMLSACAWAAMFFNHVAGFMYAPFLLVVMIYGVATANTVSRMSHVVAYGLAVFVAYALSLWYGMTWSFPYSLDLYPQIFGKSLGIYFVNQWLSITILICIGCLLLLYYVWIRRDYIILTWSRRNLGALLGTFLLISILFVIAFNLFQAYRLGFTSHFSDDVLLNNRYNLSNVGIYGFSHSTFIALTTYVSPFIILFVLTMLVRNRRNLSRYTTSLILLIFIFLLARVGLDNFTFYYYYGRYLCVELLPYILIVAVVWMSELNIQYSLRRKLVLVGVVGLTSVWSITLLAQQYPGGELHRLDSSMRPLVDKVQDNDLLVLAGGEYPALRTALDYYYGKNTIVADSTDLRETIRMGLKKWSDVYVLSDSDGLLDYSYIEAISLVRDMYWRNDIHNLTPSRSMVQNKQYYLYKVNRPASKFLRDGDVIAFDDKGNSGTYIGTGWSNQESSYRWTEGQVASLELPVLSSNYDLALRFEVRSHNCVNVSVRVNGSIRTRWTFADCSEYSERVVVLGRDDLSTGKVVVTFDMPEVVSPHEVNPKFGDTRKLGISVIKAVVEKITPGRSLERQTSKFFRQLQQGINFSASDLAAVILSTEGLSAVEPWGRWTDGDFARIRFKDALPKRFDLSVTGGAYGPNIGKPIKFKVGSRVREVVFASDAYEKPQTYHVEFKLDTPSDMLEIFIPFPSKPSSGDQRKLGVGLVDLKITE